MATGNAGPFSDLLVGVAPLASRFVERGHQLHLVGGCVRDTILGLGHGDDLDLTTDARPDRILELVGPVADVVWTQGRRFGTIGARIDGRSVEITTHRTEQYDPGSRKPDVAFADALEEDLARRDFTINAMAVDAVTGLLVDPYGGSADLAAKVLRTPLQAEISFTDDPLRMLRAGRFLARFELTPADDVRRAAAENASRLDIVSAERIFDELTKLLATTRPSRGLAFLAEVGLLDRVLPAAELGPHVDTVEPDPALRMAALLAASSEDEVRRRLGELRASNELTDRITGLVAALGSMPTELSPAALREWLVSAGEQWRDAVAVGRVVRPDLGESLAVALDDLAVTEDLDDWSLPIDGRAVMDALGLEPGPAVGQALDRLRRHRLEHGPFTAEEAVELLRGD